MKFILIIWISDDHNNRLILFTALASDSEPKVKFSSEVWMELNSKSKVLIRLN